MCDCRLSLWLRGQIFVGLCGGVERGQVGGFVNVEDEVKEEDWGWRKVREEEGEEGGESDVVNNRDSARWIVVVVVVVVVCRGEKGK